MKAVVFLMVFLIAAPLGAQTVFDPYSPGGSTNYDQWQRDREHGRQLRELEEQNRRLRALESQRQRERDYYNNPWRPMRPQGRDCGPFRQIC